MYSRLSVIKRNSNEKPVQDHLSITPSQMYQMAQEGTPVSAQNLGMVFDEGYSQLDFVPDLEHRRGVDISDMWDARMNFRKKVNDAKVAGKMQPVSE